MPLYIKCDFCHKELDEPGGIVLYPPLNGFVRKVHVCQECVWKIFPYPPLSEER